MQVLVGIVDVGNDDSNAQGPEFEAAGFPFLLNEQAIVERGGERLHFVALLDDPNHYKKLTVSERALRQVPADAFKVLLSHSPETFREAALLGFDFMLSGHTHGGSCVYHLGFRWFTMEALRDAYWRGAGHGPPQGYTGRETGVRGFRCA